MDPKLTDTRGEADEGEADDVSEERHDDGGGVRWMRLRLRGQQDSRGKRGIVPISAFGITTSPDLAAPREPVY